MQIGGGEHRADVWMTVCYTGCCVPGLKRRLFNASPFLGLSGGCAVSGGRSRWGRGGICCSFSPPSKTGVSVSVRLLLMSKLNSISLLETLFSPIKILQHVSCDNKSELSLISPFLRCLLEDGNAHLEKLIVVIYLSVVPRSPCSG